MSHEPASPDPAPAPDQPTYSPSGARAPGTSQDPPAEAPPPAADAPPAPAAAPEAPSFALSGEAADRYELRGELGRGGMGAVFRVFDRDLEREVALKVLFDDIGADPGCAARFVAEARAMAGLQHPAIIPVYDIGQDAAGRAYFTMRLVEGRTLSRVIGESRLGGPEASREFSLFRLLEMVVEVCRAVAFAHGKGVIHRDLKPQNVMVGAYGEVQVMDWGLAKDVRRAAPGGGASGEHPAVPPAAPAPVLRQGMGTGTAARPGETPPSSPSSGSSTSRRFGRLGSGSAETVVGMIIGTPAYMAPEQALGDPGKIGAPADIFALGAILYHTLTGRPPFQFGEGDDVLEIVKSLAYTAPRALDPSVPPELDAICVRAMSARPGDRYPSADALAKDVQAFLEHEPVSAYPEGRTARLRKWARRHRRGLLAGVAAALLSGGLGVGMVELEETRMARTAAESRAGLVREGERLLAEAEGRARAALDALRAGRRPLWERRAATLEGGELRLYFSRAPTSELEAKDRLLAHGAPEPPTGAALERFRAADDERRRDRRAGEASAREADPLFASARDRFVEAGDHAASRRAETRRLLHLACLATARDDAAGARSYLNAASPDLRPEDAPLVALARGRSALAVSLKGARRPAARASVYAVDPTTLEVAATPFPTRTRLALPLEIVDLAPGEYVVEIEEPGAAPIRFPVLLASEDRWVEELPLGPSDVPPGMLYVSAGPALVGTRLYAADEGPPRFLQVPAFCIARCELTVEEAAAIAAATRPPLVTGAERDGVGGTYDVQKSWIELPGVSFRDPSGDRSSPESVSRLPATVLSQEEAAALATAAGARLPRDVEWERAARGIDGRRSPWGEEPTEAPGPRRANTFSYAAVDPDGYARWAPVASYPAGASPFGALDMLGNVYEWIAGPFLGRAELPGPPDAGPAPPDALGAYAGCCWNEEGADTRIAYRAREEKRGLRNTTVGVRLAKDAP